MVDDLNKTPREQAKAKKKIPLYILIVAGIFLLALVFYMATDMKPDPSDAPPGHPDVTGQPSQSANVNSDATN